MRTLVWDPAPGETRCVLLEEGRPVALHLWRTCFDAPYAAAHSQHRARLVSRLGNGRGLVQLASGEEALLFPVPPGAEGATMDIEITRERLPEPGRWKRALARPAEPEAETREDPLVALTQMADAIVCASLSAAQDADRFGRPVHIDAAAVADADLEGLLETARTGLVSFEGGELSIERTRAMTVIDVDGHLPPGALNSAAARAIADALRLFNITGPIGIDLVGMASRADRQAVDTVLAEACAVLGPQERTSINGFGFCQIIRPRHGPSIAEQLCGTTPGRLSIESQALALLRQAARSSGIGPRVVTARPAVIDLLRRWSPEIEAVRRMTGADVKFVSDPAASGYGNVHVSPA